MKLGQMASYLDQGMPEHVRAALAELQHDAPPMSRELADAAFERELGLKPDEAFLEWDPTPIAAASIGQVHRALTHDGRAVAVKVQYPGVDEAVEADLGNVGLLFAGMGLMFPGLEHAPLVDELRERLREELDYRKEARNQRRFADFYRGHPVIHVPDVVEEFCTQGVLTTELAEGVRWDEMLTWPQHERNLAAETIYRFAFGSLYQLHTFNGDPHPGNYLFQKGGRVTFLDFGLVKHFTDDDLRVFEDMTRTMVLENDVAAFRRTVEQIGFLRPGGSFTDEEVGEYFGHFYEFVFEDRVRTITTDYASENVRRFFDASGPFGDIMKAANVPPSMVIIQRINLGLYAIFGEMGATATGGGSPRSSGPSCTQHHRHRSAKPSPHGRLRTARGDGMSSDDEGRGTQTWVERDAAVVWHGFTQMATYADNTPIVVDRADGRELIATDGTRYLDAISSLWVNTLGHRVPELDAALHDQLGKVAHSTLLGNGNRTTIRFAEALAQHVPVEQPHLLFASDGAAAVEQALKIAFQFWTNQGVRDRTAYLTLGQAYHGDTIGSISLGRGRVRHGCVRPVALPGLAHTRLRHWRLGREGRGPR